MNRSLRPIIAELDEVADQLEKKGQKKLAAQLDRTSNTLEKFQANSDRKARGKAADLGFPQGGGASEPPPGSDEADEAGHQDSFDATVYHKVPVGQDSVSGVVNDSRSLADILDRIDLAEEGEVNIQASKKRKAEGDTWSTSGLPESGDENETPPPDKDQEGETLEFFGTEKPGELHMPTGASDGEEEDISREARRARKILRQATELVVETPDELHENEPGEDVERDQSLGGRGDGGGSEKDLPLVDDDAVLEDDSDDDSDEEETASVEFANRGASALRKKPRRRQAFRTSSR